MNKNHSLQCLLATISILLYSCCSYLPFVDVPYSLDFERHEYKFHENSRAIINNDSLVVEIKAAVWLPNKCRSKKLGRIFTSIVFTVKSNRIQDEIILPIEHFNQVTVSDGQHEIEGRFKMMKYGNTDLPAILIKGRSISVLQGDIKDDSLVYQFSYSSLSDFDYKNHVLKLKFGDARVAGQTRIYTNTVFGEYRDVSR